MAAVLLAHPLQFHRRTREGILGEEQEETVTGVGNVSDQPVDHLRDAGDERLFVQTDARIVEHPQAAPAIWLNHKQGVLHAHRSFWRAAPVTEERSHPNPGGRLKTTVSSCPGMERTGTRASRNSASSPSTADSGVDA